MVELDIVEVDVVGVVDMVVEVVVVDVVIVVTVPLVLDVVELVVDAHVLVGDPGTSRVMNEITWQVSGVVVPHGFGAQAPVGNGAAT